MVTHSPAPWTWNEYGELESAGGERAIVITDGWYFCQNKADKSLLAAAPELLEALRVIAYEPIGDAPEASHEEVLDAITTLARAAIAKATGQP